MNLLPYLLPYLHRHTGVPFVVIGKGPTLDAWVAAGCPQPAGAVRIGVNQVAAIVPDVPYSVSGDCAAEAWLHLPTQWFRGVPYGRPGGEVVDALPTGAGIPFDGRSVPQTERLARLTLDAATVAATGRLYCALSSANPAVHLAWLMGASEVMLVGIDGGTTRAACLAPLPDREPPPTYDAMKASVQAECDALFGTRWWHWAAPKSQARRQGEGETLRTGEFWKYDGIYTAQASGKGYAGYGHSNHGQKALPWLLEQGFTSLLDVGCGHNQLVKAWTQQSTGSAPRTGTGVDFACPGADVIADATALPFPDGWFDVVTSFDMLEHLPEHEVLPALREMERVSWWFCFSIATAPSRILWQGHNLHPTVQPMSWWLDRISEAGGVIDNDGPAGYVCGRWQAPE